MCDVAQNKNGRIFRSGRHAKLDPAKPTSRDASPRPIRKFLARLLLRRGGRADLLLDGALQLEGARRQHGGLGLEQEGIEAAIVVDALDRVGGDAQAHVAAQRFADEGHVDQVRQEAALGLDVGVADRVADLGGLGRQFAAARHGKILNLSQRCAAAIRGATGKFSVLAGSGRTYRGEAAGRQGFGVAGTPVSRPALGVIARLVRARALGRAIQYSAPVRLTRGAAAYWMPRSSRGMTAVEVAG